MGMQGGGGGGGSASRGYNYGAQLSQALQTIWGPQGAALSNMYGGVSNLMNQQAGQVPGAAQQLSGQSLPYAQQGMRQMAQFANPNSALARRQLGDYSQQVGQEFARNILPQLRTGAGIGGNMGGSREALARGVAGGDAARAIAQGGTDLYAHQYDLAQSAAGMLPQMAGQYFGLGMQPYQAAWAPYTSAAGIFGGPQALSGQQSFNLGENWNNQMGNPTRPSWGFNLG
jgi:hypothetical protein